MNQLTITLAGNRTGFRPGDMLRGTAEWQLPNGPAAVEMRLGWWIEVQGIIEVRRVQTARFDRVLANDSREFQFPLPDAPYSYAGSLATLSWVVELVVLPQCQFTQVFFNLGPNAEPVQLQEQLNSDEAI